MQRRQALWLPAVLAGCALPTEPPVRLPDPVVKNGLGIRVGGLLRRGTRIVGVAGVAKNMAGKDFRLVSLYFDMLYGDGLKVAEAVANTSGLAVGQTWAFEAMILTPGRPFDYIGSPRVTVL